MTSDDKVSHLSLAETHCPCGRCEANGMEQRVIDLFEILRDLIGHPITINSAARCAVHNQNIGGRPNSQHLYGRALDMAVPQGYDVDTFAQEVRKAGFGGVGRYYKKRFVHGDCRVGRFDWEVV